MWPLNFISEEDFTKHVKLTIEKYDKKLEPINLEKFNKNIIDPVKLIFDKKVYSSTWEEIIKNEIFRQRDKSNNNDIGYFHQEIFKYIKKCTVPPNGQNGGWDVIVKDSNGILLADGDKVSTIYVELKNKHNTMNSSASSKTFMKMQNQLLQDDNCACFLVEVIAKQSQDIKWAPSVDGRKMGHKFIRRVSIDKFYSLVTGQEDAFYQMCLVLPNKIAEVVDKYNSSLIPKDTVIEELRAQSDRLNIKPDDLSMIIAIYMLGFNTYNGFDFVIKK